MKLSKIALSVVALLGIIQLGGSYYTGTQLEEKYQNYIDDANKELKVLRAYGIEAKIENFKLARHFFSSNAEYQVTLNKIDSSDSKDNIIFKGIEKINHGPFPLNNIIKGKLLPKMISTENTLYLPEKIKTVSKNGILLTGVTDVSYTQAIHSKLDTENIAYKNSDDEILEVKPVNIEIDSDKGNLGINTTLESLFIKDKKRVLLAKNMTYKADTNKSEFANIQLGDSVLKGKLIQVQADGGNIVSLKKLTSTSLDTLKDKKIVSNSKISLELELQNGEKNQNLGTFNLDADLMGDPKSWNAFIEKVRTQNLTDDAMHYEAAKAMAEGLTFKINDFSLKNKVGKNTLALDVNLDKFNPDLLLNIQDVLNIFKKSTLDVTLNMPTTRVMLEQINLLKMNEEEAKLAAQQALSQFMYPIEKQGLAYIKDENAILQLAINEGKISLNGKILSEKELKNLFFFLMIFSMSGGLSH